MAVLAPVLERKINTESDVTAERSRNIFMSSNNYAPAPERSRNALPNDDASHNSRIKANYERLINPESTVKDVFNNEPVQSKGVEEPVAEQKPFWVENARADSDLFRVDSIINNRQAEKYADAEPATEQDEEENEDLRPSEETFKYRTIAETKVVVNDKVNKKQASASRFSKRDKIIMAVAIVVIIALFALVIINSAVLSNLNSEVSNLQYDLAVAQENYSEAETNSKAFWDNVEQTVADFARQNGMSKIAGEN